jgi:hypothetical protein
LFFFFFFFFVDPLLSFRLKLYRWRSRYSDWLDGWTAEGSEFESR